MSSSKIELLKKKPIPQKKRDIIIELPKPIQKVKVEIQIKDKRGDIKINRKQLLEKMKLAPPRPLDELPKTLPTLTSTSTTSDKKKKKQKGKRKVFTLKKTKMGEVLKGTITPHTRLTKEIDLTTLEELPETMVSISDPEIQERLPEQDTIEILGSEYFMNNRDMFSNFINKLYQPYRDEIMDESKDITCESMEDSSDGFSLMTHQKIVKDYLAHSTPYRGLLLYHGLGSGKTCSSIAIAEGLKTHRMIYILTPASLRTNYIEEIKKCGDILYKKNQYWEFVSITENPEYLNVLSEILSLSKDYIIKNKGAWLVNIKKKSNYDTLNASEMANLENQLDVMISNKYRFINYNGIRLSHLETLTSGFKNNPFDNSVIVVDEAHNLVSRIVNKLKNEESLAMRLYRYIMSANNAKVVLLTGTPVVNYPNEISILFNMLRGYIKSWSFQLLTKSGGKIDQKTIEKILFEIRTLDYVEYKPSTKRLVITRNPYGFFKKSTKRGYQGVLLNESGQMSDVDFKEYVIRILRNNGIDAMVEKPSGQENDYVQHTALPDELDQFRSLFINMSKGKGDMKNKVLFKRRILGLTSYFRSAKEDLMPEYEKDSNFHLVKIPMSDYQFDIYEQARVQERKLEKASTKKSGKKKEDLYSDTVSTYRIFSRAFCNFVFPRAIQRPLPNDEDTINTELLEKIDEDAVDAKTTKETLLNPDGKHDLEDKTALDHKLEDTNQETYVQRIQEALKKLKEKSDSFLSQEALQTYSPKFLHILETIMDEKNEGLHMLYTQFRTIEGIGIFSLILEQNGFARFKIKNVKEEWELDLDPADVGKPMYALYTGTETPEEKEIIRNVFNSDWQYIPKRLADQLDAVSSNNYYGEIIKLLMITSSGAEGITLKNVRFVHIVEPYWHPARKDQVIGRARRICSHSKLPKKHRTVDVFLYLMQLTKDQLDSDKSVELKKKDLSKYDSVTPVTSDETLHEISSIKEEINKQLLTAVKESSIDCAIHSRSGSKEPLACYSIGKANKNTFSYRPSYLKEEKDTVAVINEKKITWTAKRLQFGARVFALRKNSDGTETNKLYDYDSYKQATEIEGINPIYIGRLVKVEIDGKKKFKIDKKKPEEDE